MSVKITYNAPVILTFTLLSFVLLLFNIYIKNINGYFASPGHFEWSNAGDYLNLFSYVFAHDTRTLIGSKFAHFMANFTIILLVGPAIEEKYGSKNLIVMMLVTAFITAVLNALLFDNNIIGASGLALMMIILSSFTNYKKGDLPMTFVVICVFFLGNEIVSAFKKDEISQFAHIVGGVSGAFFGFYHNKR